MLFVADRFSVRGRFPCGDVCVVFVIPHSFSIVGLMLVAKVHATGFVAIQSVTAHQLAKFEIVLKSQSLLEFAVGLRCPSRHAHVGREFGSQFLNVTDR